MGEGWELRIRRGGFGIGGRERRSLGFFLGVGEGVFIVLKLGFWFLVLVVFFYI